MKFFKTSFIFILFSLINLVFIKESGNLIYDEESDEVEITLDKEFNEEIKLNKDNNKKYIFHIKESKFLYFFESSGISGYIHYEKDNQCSNLCAVQYNPLIHENILYINYYKNATEQNIIIKISSLENFDGQVKSIKSNDMENGTIYPVSLFKSFLIFESYVDFIFYFQPLDETSSIKCAEYNKEMSKSDIININDKYFNNCKNKINEIKPNSVYIFSFLHNSYNKPLKILIQPKIKNDIISISDDKTNILYLSNEKEGYTLDFTNNTINRMIQLSRLSINSEISIDVVDSNQNIKLNKNNLYFLINEANIFTGKLTVKIKKEMML